MSDEYEVFTGLYGVEIRSKKRGILSKEEIVKILNNKDDEIAKLIQQITELNEAKEHYCDNCDLLTKDKKESRILKIF